MKFRVTMKTPDALWDAVHEAVDAEVDDLGLPADEADALKAMRAEKERAACGRWFRYGEYLAVDIDTAMGTCTVVEVAV